MTNIVEIVESGELKVESECHFQLSTLNFQFNKCQFGIFQKRIKIKTFSAHFGTRFDNTLA